MKARSLSHLKPSYVVSSLLEDHEAVELAAAGVQGATVLEEERRPVRLRRKTSLRIVGRILEPLAFLTGVHGVVERAVNVGQVPLSDALADDKVLSQQPALRRPSHAKSLRAVLVELVDVLVDG